MEKAIQGVLQKQKKNQAVILEKIQGLIGPKHYFFFNLWFEKGTLG